MKLFNFNYMKLRDKLILMYILSVFIPIVVTNIVFYQVTTTNIRSQKVSDADMALNNLKDDLRITIDNGVSVSYSLYADHFLNLSISQHYTSQIEYIEAYHSYLKGLLSSQNVLGIIYTDNPTVLSSGYIEKLTDRVRQAEWYVQSHSSSASFPVLVYTDRQFSLIQWLNNYYSGGIEQLVKVDLDMEEINQAFQAGGFNGNVYFVDPKGTVRYSNAPIGEVLNQSIQLSDIELPNKSLQFKASYDGINYLEGWTLHGIIDEEMVMSEVRKSGVFVFWLACINFVLPTIIIAVMTRSLHVRLVRILKHMKKVKTQNFQTIPPEDARDEIGQLTLEFNRMTKTIHNLINEVYLADIQKKDLELKQQKAQLHALHSQINPHFLFNALESVRMRSIIKGEKETARIIQHMAHMFRQSISWNRNYVTVREELELIDSYLGIQQYRYGEKLEYSIVADPSAIELRIPKMVILPFVENASIHGIESSPEKGVITIWVAMKNNMLHIMLEDNGIGMSQAKLEELKRYIDDNDDMGERVGMKNAYYRLKLCYRQRFSFLITSEEGLGTHIYMELPLELEES